MQKQHGSQKWFVSPKPNVLAKPKQGQQKSDGTAMAPSLPVKRLRFLKKSRTQPVTIIRQSGVIFEGEQGKKYAQAIGRIVETVHAGLDDVSGDNTEAVSSQYLSHNVQERYNFIM